MGREVLLVLELAGGTEAAFSVLLEAVAHYCLLFRDFLQLKSIALGDIKSDSKIFSQIILN